MDDNVVVYAYNKGYRITKEGDLVFKNGKPRSLNICSNGYYNATIRNSKGKTTRLWIHKLQAYQKFKKEALREDIVTRHFDGNPLNNTWENILIGTQSENMMDIPREVRTQSASNPKHNHEAIIKDRENGMTYKELMNKYNISSKGTVSFIINKSLEKNGVLV